jgi:2-oxoisovalerate dehydrogenase E2 component (dihydrolipoyl transacylase)
MNPLYCPDLGEGLEEATIVSWSKKIGDRILEDETLVTLETDKTVVDIPAHCSGYLLEQGGTVGDRIHKGALLFVLGDQEAKKEVQQKNHQKISRSDRQSVKAMPKARALAESYGLDLTRIKPKQGDCLMPADVLSHWADINQNKDPSRALLNDEERAHHAMIQTMESMNQKAVVCTLSDDADISAWSPGEDVTVRLLYAMGYAAQKYPRLNSLYDDQKKKIIQLDTFNVHLAVQHEHKLLMPTVEGVLQYSPVKLRQRIDQLKEDKRRESCVPAAMLLSNIGRYGGSYARAMVMSPSIITLVAGRERPGVCLDSNGQPFFGRQLPLSLNFDHRALSGAQAAQFLGECLTHLRHSTFADKKMSDIST